MNKQNDKFEINVEQLTELFNIENYRNRHNNEMLKNFGFTDGIMKKLKTNQNDGINDNNSQEMRMRASIFGTNQKLIYKKTYLDCWFEVFQDMTIRFYCITSFLLILINAWIQGWHNSWQEGGQSLISLLIYASVLAGNNFLNEKYIAQIHEKINQRYYSIIRGSKTIELNQNDILVGDILSIKSGEIMPADGMLLQSDNLVVEEYEFVAEKQPLDQGNYKSACPWIYNRQVLKNGTALVLILAVGKNTFNSRQGYEMDVQNNTPFEEQLCLLQDKIGKFGVLAAICIFLVLLLNLIYESIFGSMFFFSANCIKEILNILTISAATFLISIPEGLPVAVAFTASSFYGQMKKNHILLKDIIACEKIGEVNHIIIQISLNSEKEIQQKDLEGLQKLVQQSKDLKVEIIMVTQNSFEMGVNLAQKIGLLEINYEFNQDSLVVMEGKTFRNMVDQNNFHKISSKLKLLTSSTQEDLQSLAARLQEQGNAVAYVGPNMNGQYMKKHVDLIVSVESLSKINCSNIEILDGNYQSILNLIGWGRRFAYQIQNIVIFNLIIGIIVFLITLVWILFQKKSLFNLGQLLWINLIMDSFAITILGTEKQGNKIFSNDNFSIKESIINNNILRNNLSKVISQILLLTAILLFSQNYIQSFTMQKLEAILFNSFILIQGLNLITINKANPLQIKKEILLKTISAIILPQIIFMFNGELFFHIASLDASEQIICFLAAFLSLILSDFINLVQNQAFRINNSQSKLKNKMD